MGKATRALALCPCLLASSVAQAGAGDLIVTAGFVNIDNKLSYSTPQHNELGSSIATQTGLVPSKFDSPGTEETIGGAVKPILTLTYFMTDHWAITAVGGVPPKLDVIGHGSVTTPGLLNKVVPAVEMGKAENNPIATIRHWFPSVMVQYYFGDPSGRWRPFIGAGLGFSFFTDVKLTPNFDNNLRQAGSFLALATTLSPQNTTEAKASSAWRPLFNAGLAYHLNDRWSLGLAVSYVPIKTVSTIRIRDKTGNVVLTSSADLDIPTVASSATIGFKF
jgi:outer membrane protein